ncbi:DUF2851 family protein [Chitinophaga barathri]|uniref:DUF2851 family protein n=1 Tax=Chitinophaga barathri TaxID=1647451 RepID=A0A3N4MJY5_9BACT|nr:DUF2851 family protein [Chitinophaga barathri]RPD42386.1 DUF2851 family protein [Chitinophaga barathri]
MLSVNPLCSEALLQYIWLSGHFDPFGLATVTGEPVTILNPGQLNRDGGPDFTAARLRIAGMEWAGNVELHYRTSDWRRHGHQHNPRYHNVILHVVFEHDLPGPPQGIPVLELQRRIPKILLRRYRHLMDHTAFVPCAPLLHRVPEEVWERWTPRLIEERLARKTEVFRNWLEQTRFNWEEVCTRAMAQGYGMPVNTAAFLELFQSIPFMLLARTRPYRQRLEALLFGQAGMLETAFQDTYPKELQSEYRFLQHKHGLQSMPAHRWQWLRMRPTSFPSLRIAHFAAVLHNTPHLFSRLLDTEDIPALEKLLEAGPSPYWQYHYRLDVPSVSTAAPGRHILHHIMINTVVPLLYLYGKHMRLPQYQQRALDLLDNIPAENNRIIRGWAEEKVPSITATDSQSLLQLKQCYCDAKRCLECKVGKSLLGDDINVCREDEEDQLWGAER